MSNLRKKVIKLAYNRPDLRGDLLPLVSPSTKTASPSLGKLLADLDSLGELSQSIEDVTEAFSMHYRTAGIPTEVTSQIDALRKARGGLAKAQEVQKGVLGLLEMFPEDKTAQRAAKDAATMIKRFERNSDAAAKMIRTLSKKSLPPALKKMSAAVARGIRKKLTDPKALVVIPWVVEDVIYSTNLKGSAFQMVFRILDPSKWGGKIEIILAESTIREIGPYVYEKHNTRPTTTTSAKVVEAFVGQLRGYAGLVGEADKIKSRTETAAQIASALKRWGRGEWDSDTPSVERGGQAVTYGFRRDTRWEDYSTWERDDGAGREELEIRKTMGPALESWNSQIRQYSVAYGEKGWWSVYVQLK